MKLKIYPILAFYFALLTSCSGRIATVQVTVVDESGKPIENASVEVGFSPVPPSRQGVSGNGRTNTDGIFSFTGDGYISFTAVANKTGYYESRVQGFINDYGPGGGGKPLDPKIRMVLRPIRNPVKMYYWRRLMLPLPERGKPAGLDLEKGDWVTPLGSGSKTDLYLTVDDTFVNELNWSVSLTMSFPNSEDGVQTFKPVVESALKSPYQAPVDSYTKLFKWTNGVAEIKDQWGTANPKLSDNRDPNQGFVLRMRTVIDSNGKIISAHYGKLLNNPIVDDPRAKPEQRTIVLEYLYLNPTVNDRNLEFKVGDALNQQKERLNPDLP